MKREIHSSIKLQVQWKRVPDRLVALWTFALVRASLPFGRTAVAARVSAGKSDVLRTVHADGTLKLPFELVGASSMHLA